MTQHPVANWYPDPLHRYEVRYWDGGTWTEHVATQGSQAIDPPVSVSQAPTVGRANTKVERQVRRAGVAEAVEAGGGTVFSEPVLVVNQKAKIFEVKAEYAIYDQRGQKIGAVRQVGENMVKKAMAVRDDESRKRRFQIVDANGRVLLELTRPAKYFRSKMIVKDGNRAQVGLIAQTTFGILGNHHFRLESGGQRVGSINAEDGRELDFNIQNASGDEIGRITKTWAGAVKERFTKGDHYVVEIADAVEGPLRWLVIAAAVTIDTALNQERDWSQPRTMF